VVERWQGLFWLLTPAERQAVEQREQAIGQADPLPAPVAQAQVGRGLVAFQSGLYGEAAAYLERAIESGPPADILARRTLAQLYENVAGELGRIGKHDLAQPFARAADEQYEQLRAMVKESKE